VWLEVIPLLQIVLGDEIFLHWNDLYSKTTNTQELKQVFRGKTESFLGATCVKLPISFSGDQKSIFSPDNIVEFTDSEEAVVTTYKIWLSNMLQNGPIPENVWPSQNIFLDQYAFILSGEHFSKEVDGAHRGFWVLWSPEEVYICPIVDAFYYIGAKLGCHFRLIDGKFVLCRDPGDCQLGDDDVHITQLAVFLCWTKSIEEGKGKLTEVVDRIFHFEWQ
jgi:hypothetical protein